MFDAPNEQWMTKREAAAYLGISVRSLERMMAGGQIAFAYKPGKTFDIAVFKAEDVAALKAARERPVYPQRRHRAGQRRRTRQELFADLEAKIARMERKAERKLRFLAEALLELHDFARDEARAWAERNLSLQDEDQE